MLDETPEDRAWQKSAARGRVRKCRNPPPGARDSLGKGRKFAARGRAQLSLWSPGIGHERSRADLLVSADAVDRVLAGQGLLFRFLLLPKAVA